jgi:hypothetical protein
MWWDDVLKRWVMVRGTETVPRIIERPWLMGGGFDVLVSNRRVAWFRERPLAETFLSMTVQMAEGRKNASPTKTWSH